MELQTWTSPCTPHKKELRITTRLSSALLRSAKAATYHEAAARTGRISGFCSGPPARGSCPAQTADRRRPQRPRKSSRNTSDGDVNVGKGGGGPSVQWPSPSLPCPPLSKSLEALQRKKADAAPSEAHCEARSFQLRPLGVLELPPRVRRDLVTPLHVEVLASLLAGVPSPHQRGGTGHTHGKLGCSESISTATQCFRVESSLGVFGWNFSSQCCSHNLGDLKA